MKILHWNFSDIFKSYHDFCISNLKKAPKWYYTDALPDPYKTYQGAYDPTSGDIYLNKSMAVEQAEVVAAHELTHATRHRNHPATQTANAPMISRVGSELQSCLQDIDVFKTLSEYGFDVSDELDLRAKEALVICEIHNTPESFPILPISYVEYYYYFHKNILVWGGIDKTFKERQPQAHLVGNELLKQTFGVEFSDPRAVKSVLDKWVSILKLGGLVKVVMPSVYRPNK